MHHFTSILCHSILAQLFCQVTAILFKNTIVQLTELLTSVIYTSQYECAVLYFMISLLNLATKYVFCTSSNYSVLSAQWTPYGNMGTQKGYGDRVKEQLPGTPVLFYCVYCQFPDWEEENQRNEQGWVRNGGAYEVSKNQIPTPPHFFLWDYLK